MLRFRTFQFAERQRIPEKHVFLARIWRPTESLYDMYSVSMEKFWNRFVTPTNMYAFFFCKYNFESANVF